jgi:glycosyltransferase involved in cell wall biosynthesis
MRIAYITAGAAGMYCGSCLHDNTLAATLQTQGHDAILIPTYTPIKTDEPDVSQQRVFFGGINVYLQQKLSLFRHTPWVLDRLLDAPRLLRWVSRFAVRTRAEDLGDLTLSVLRGEHGHQRKEIDKLVTWLAAEVRPDLVMLTNALLSGMVHELKARLGVPVLCTLQGDDIFLEALPTAFREQALALVREHCRQIDGFIATSAYYADFMAGYLAIQRERIHVVHPGLNLAGHGGPRAPGGSPHTIGYFARICPEKGLHLLAEAFRILRQTPGVPASRLRVSGWLGENNRPYFEEIRGKITAWGLADDFVYVESPDHAGKVRFLQGLDVLSVPTTYREPKGLYVLEALANGVPVVQPRHGSFPELIEATGGGLLVNPEDPADLARGLRQLLEDAALRDELGRRGREAVHRDFHAGRMAEKSLAVFQRYLGLSPPPENAALAVVPGSRAGA